MSGCRSAKSCVRLHKNVSLTILWKIFSMYINGITNWYTPRTRACKYRGTKALNINSRVMSSDVYPHIQILTKSLLRRASMRLSHIATQAIVGESNKSTCGCGMSWRPSYAIRVYCDVGYWWLVGGKEYGLAIGIRARLHFVASIIARLA